jgi:hypothetical protein
MNRLSSASGVTVSYDKSGSGPPLLLAGHRLSVRPITRHARTREVMQRAVPPSMKVMTTMSHNGR